MVMDAAAVTSLTEHLRHTRADFPILGQEVRPGVPLIYLDNAATSQKPLAVIEAEAAFYRQINANVHRGVHTFSEKATAAYEAARQKVRLFINAAASAEIIFTRNTTESINLVAYAWGLWALRPGDEIIITEMEHHANIVPWQMIAQRAGAVVRHIPITEDGHLQMEQYAKLLESGRVKMVAVGHVSNVLGVVNPVAQITAMAHSAGALVCLDAAQSVPHMRLDVRGLGVDFAAFSGHKMLGPTGIGVLYGRRELLEAMPPFQGGGSMIDRVELDKSTYAGLPQRFEAGTPNIAGAVGLGAAIDYLTHIGLENVHAHEKALVGYAMEGLASIPGLRMYGPPAEQRAGLVAFTLKGVHAHDLSQGLDHAGIAVRAGHHCTMPLHERYGVAASTRASFYVYNTLEEARKLIETVEKVGRFFAR